jgi:hypothetical protein
MLHSHNHDDRVPPFIWAADLIGGLTLAGLLVAAGLVLGMFTNPMDKGANPAPPALPPIQAQERQGH